MIEQQRQQLWDSVFEKTQQMLLFSQQAEWERLVLTEVERRELMNDFFSSKVSEEDSQLVAKGIKSLLEADQKIVAICQKHKQELNQQMSGISQGKKASVAYGENS